jgi:hypothetical protein
MMINKKRISTGLHVFIFSPLLAAYKVSPILTGGEKEESVT